MLLRVSLKKGANFDTTDCDGFSPFKNSIKHGQVDVIKYLLECISDGDEIERTVKGSLLLAARHGQKDVISLLVEMHKQINLDYNEELRSSLAEAISHGHFECVRLLHSLGATPFSLSRHKLLKCLSKCDTVDIYLYLLVFGTDPEAANSIGDKISDHLCYTDRIDWDIFKNVLSPLTDASRKEINMSDLVNLPGLGSIKSLSQGLAILSNLQQTILDRVEKITEMVVEQYSVTTELIGSMAESTKVGFPDEFDIILQKDVFFHLDRIVDVGHAYRKCDDDKDPLHGTSKTFHSDMWVFLDYKDDMLISKPTAVAGDGAACTCIKMRYQDEKNKERSLTVSVDLVPVLHVEDWPNDAIQKTWMMNSEELKAQGYQLVARPPHRNTEFGKTFSDTEREKLYRVTFSLLEVKHIKELEDRVKKAYILAKCLRNPVACRIVVKDEGIIHFVGKFVTSYFLKTVFMHNVEDFLAHERPLVEMAYILYSQLTFCLSHGFIPIFWMPKTNLLEGVDISAAKAHKVAAHMKAHIAERYREELHREPPEDVNDNIEIPPDCPLIDFTEASGTEILSLPLKLSHSGLKRRSNDTCKIKRKSSRYDTS